jgi:type IV secretory pathway VirB2 component (pilin)
MNESTSISWSQFTEWLSDPVVGGIVGGLALVYVLGFCSIFARAGFHWALGTLMLIPGVNVLLFLLVSFGSWPNSRELKSLRKLETAVTEAENRHRRAA